MTPQATEKRLAGVIAAFVAALVIWACSRSCELERRELVEDRAPTRAGR